MPAPRTDATLASAVEVARQAALEVGEPGAVGDHLGVEMEAERLATHFFACTAAAYPGWRWAITLARAPRARRATVCETHLVPGPEALLSPAWVPYAERLAPGDVPGCCRPRAATPPPPAGTRGSTGRTPRRPGVPRPDVAAAATSCR